MATNSEQILDLVNVKIIEAEQVKEYSQEQISILGASKEPQHSAIDALDTLLFDETNAINNCLLYTSPSPRDATLSRMPSSA